jgi:translocation and assembly module TamA
MRGFNSRRLSPQIAVFPEPSDDPDDPPPAPVTVPVGGNSLFETSLEVRYRLTQSLVVASFWDTGYVGRDPLSLGGEAFQQRLYHAVGLGLRYLTVVGPIRLDIARRLNVGAPLFVSGAGYTYPDAGSCFGLGSKKSSYAGAPEGLCTFQLSIGEAF